VKNYRRSVDAALDLADPCDPIDLAQTCENAAAFLRLAAQVRDKVKEERKLMEAVAPWFDMDQMRETLAAGGPG
jgi:hypothetical protein